MADQKKTAFEKALTDAVLARYQKTIAEDSEPVELSDSYKKSIEGLTRKTERKTWKYVNKTWKRILIAAILIVLLATTVVAAVPALREGLIRFITHDNGVAFTFEFTQEDLDRAPKEIETYYAPSYVPDGFMLVDQSILSVSSQYFYMNDTGNVFDYMQSVLWQYEIDPTDLSTVSSRFTVNSERTSIETVILQGYEVQIITMTTPQQTEDCVVLWTDHQYLYEIGAPSLEIDEIDRIIASMTIVDPE